MTRLEKGEIRKEEKDLGRGWFNGGPKRWGGDSCPKGPKFLPQGGGGGGCGWKKKKNLGRRAWAKKMYESKEERRGLLHVRRAKGKGHQTLEGDPTKEA